MTKTDISIIGTEFAGLTLAHEFPWRAPRAYTTESMGNKYKNRTRELYGSGVIGLPYGGVYTEYLRDNRCISRSCVFRASGSVIPR